MARLDAARKRISLTEDELETIRQVHNGEPVDDAARRPLADAGFVDADGQVAPLVLDLVQTVTEPMIECTVETAGPQGPTHARLAVREETVWYTDPWPQDDLAAPLTYCQDELPQILWILARLTGLRRHAVPASARPFTVPLRSIDAVLQTMAVGANDWDAARTVATARFDKYFAEVAEDDRLMLMASLSYLQATARVTTVWGPDLDTDARGIALWDCGDGGYWVRTSPAEPLRAHDVTPETLATFEPVAAGEVWRLLAGLLPSSAELRGLLDRVAAP